MLGKRGHFRDMGYQMALRGSPVSKVIKDNNLRRVA